jgi:hypothetical protein
VAWALTTLPPLVLVLGTVLFVRKACSIRHSIAGAFRLPN